MRKGLITFVYIFCAAVYTCVSLLIYQMVKAEVYESQWLSILNKAMLVTFCVIVVCIPMLLIFKSNRKAVADLVAAVVDDFISETYELLKKNVKRKEFWILQGYVLTRILTFINKSMCVFFVLPTLLFVFDSSKEVFSFVVNLITLMILIDIAKIIWTVLESNWRRCINLCLHVFILILTSVTLERYFDSVKRAGVASKTISNENELTIVVLILGYVLLIRYVRNLIIADIGRDISIDRDHHLKIGHYDRPKISLQKYKDLIKIDSINLEYRDLENVLPFEKILLMGHLRYGLLAFQVEKGPGSRLVSKDKGSVAAMAMIDYEQLLTNNKKENESGGEEVEKRSID